MLLNIKIKKYYKNYFEIVDLEDLLENDDLFERFDLFDFDENIEILSESVSET